MNWKLIGKYTGYVYLATFIIGFVYGVIEPFFFQRGAGLILAAITILLVVVVIFANLAIEQRKHTFSHAATVALLCFLISLPINVFLFHQPLLEAAISFVGISIIAIIGVGFGTIFRSRAAKLNLPVRDEVKISAGNVRIPADKIVFCLYCRTNNRIKKGTLIGTKPVCGNCGSVLEINESAGNPYIDKFTTDEYVDVEDERQAVKTTVNVVEVPTAPKLDEDLVDDALKDKFFKLLHYDYKEAYRIVDSKKRRYPTRSDRWCWEKAIEDEKSIRG